jgi:tetratricopeptide (TPR) repeat protein
MDAFVKLLLYITLIGVHLMVLFIMARGLKVRRLEGLYQKAFRAKDYPKALIAINSALELHPQSPELFHYRARVYLAQGDYAGAEADCTRSLTFYQAASVYLDRATARLSLEKPEDALIDANHVIACSRYWWKGYYIRAKAYLALGHPNVALYDLEQAIELGADQTEVQPLYAQVKEQLLLTSPNL